MESDRSLGALQQVRAPEALDQASELGSRDDLQTLPLVGVPIAIKDNVPVAGEPMRIGSVATSDAACETDHPAVQRLREAGAVVDDTTRTGAVCLDHHRQCVRDRAGGSTAAVAAAMVPLALGADGMSSIPSRRRRAVSSA